MGRAGHAADQDPLRRAEPRADGRAGRTGRGILRRHLPRHHPAGHPAPLRPHRGHAGHLPPAGGRRHHHPRGLRQLRPQRHRLPAGRRLPHRGVRRHALRQRRAPSTCSATPTRRTSAASSRSPSPAASTRPAAWSSMHDLGGIAAKRVVDGKEQRGFELYVGGGLGAVPHQAKLFDASSCPKRSCCRWPGPSAASSPGWARRRTARRPGSSSWSRSSASRSSAGSCWKSARTMPEDPSLAEVLRRDPALRREAGLRGRCR